MVVFVIKVKIQWFTAHSSIPSRVTSPYPKQEWSDNYLPNLLFYINSE